MSHTNSLAEAGAKRLARKVENYWRARGYAGIRTKIVDHVVDNVFLQPGERRTIYFIRSNIGPLGFPPREALADSKANGSQKDIAKTAGVSHPHVAKVRSDLEKSGHVETVTASIARAKEAA